MPFREDLPTLWRHVVASVPRKRRECSDGLHQNLLRKMTVALRHTKVRMTRELLDGVRGMADDFRRRGGQGWQRVQAPLRPLGNRPHLRENLRLFEDSLRGLLLLVRRVSVLAQDAF